MTNRVLEFMRRRFGYAFPRLGNRAFKLFFELVPKHVHTELVFGIFADLDLSDEVQRATYWQGERYEFPMLKILNSWVRDGVTEFFDIGSNYGFFSFALLRRNTHLNVKAFEPNPVTFAHLTEIKSRNELDRLKVWNLGLSDQCGKLGLRRGVADSGHSTFGQHPDLAAGDTELIEVLDFETWRDRNVVAIPPELRWIAKIDVEGFEMKVLSGLRYALERRAFRGIAVEVNAFTLGFCGSKPEDIYSFMASVGYQPVSESTGPKGGNEFFVPV